MIKAVYRDGVIQPVDPVPLDWTKGQELQIQRVLAADVNVELRRQFESLSDQWKEEGEVYGTVAQMSKVPSVSR